MRGAVLPAKLSDRQQLLGPQNLLAAAPDRTQAGFFRTAAGAEMDPVLDFPSGERWAVEIKWSRVPRTTKGFHLAREALAPDRCFLVGTGSDRYPVTDDVETIGLRELASDLLARPRPPTTSS